MKNKKNIYWVVSIAISIVAIFFGVYYSSSIKEFANKSDAAADVSLYLEPTTSNLVTNSVLTPMLRINPTTNQVTAIEASLTFDASKLSIESITPASNYIVLKAAVVDNTAGTASIVLGIKGGVGITPVPVTTTSDVASIRIRSKAVVGDAIIRVASTSRVAAKNIDTNVAGTYGQMTVHITAAATPTSTAVPTATATIIPTVTPTATATTYADWDVDENGSVDVIDIGIIVDNYGLDAVIRPRADVDKNGSINVIDIGIVVDHYL
jgi:hypothetical protein